MKKLLTILLAIVIAACPLMGALAAVQNDAAVYLYVSTNGNDETGDGSLDNPFKSLEAARDKIRQLKSQGNNSAFTVYVRGGEYFMPSKLSFGIDDSGTEDAPIIYSNYPGEKVTLIGGKRFGISDFDSASDDVLLDRLVDQNVRNKIYKIDLGKHGVDLTDEEPYYLGAYTREGYNPSNRGFSGCEVFVNGRAMELSRYPNSNSDVTTIYSPHAFAKGYDADGKGDSGALRSDPFVIGVIPDNHVNKWSASINASQSGSKNKVLMYGWWKYDWCDETIPIKSIGTETENVEGLDINGAPWTGDVLKLTSEWSAYLCPDHDYGRRQFYVYNLIEEMDIPGEYFIDYDTSVLYIYPHDDTNDVKIDISLNTSELISLWEAENITFSGIDITAGRKHGYYMYGCNNVKIKDCEISGTGSQAIFIKDSYNCGVSDSYIHDVNGGIVLSGGDRDTLTRGNNYVDNCHIESFSRLSKTYNGAVDVAGVGNRVTNNKIHDGPHLAISFAGQNNEIMYNEIYDVCKERYDSGAIYGGLTWIGRGCRIENNYFHDIATTSLGSMGISAVYLDGGQCDMTVSNNVFNNIDGGCIWVGGGQYVNMKNNYFIDSTYGLWLQKPDLSGKFVSFKADYDKYGLADNSIWQKEFPNLYTFMEQSDEDKLEPKNNTFINNIAFKTQLYMGGDNAFEKDYIINIDDVNLSTYTDPGFSDYEGKDFTLTGNEPILSKLTGFTPIDVSKIGLNSKPPQLKTLTLSSGEDIGFSSDRYEYSISVPYNTTEIVLPLVTATADEGVSVEVKYPSQTSLNDEDGYICVSASKDGNTTEYRIYMDVFGRNMYSNGGGEFGSWEIYDVNNAVQTSVNPAEGAYCMNIDFGLFYAPDQYPETLSANKTYLAQSMVRRSDDRTDTVDVYEVVMYVVDPYEKIEDFEKNGHGNIYCWNEDGTTRTHAIASLSDDKWIKHYRTIVPNKDGNFADIYYDPNTGLTRNFTVDEYFLGELVVSKLSIVDDKGNVPNLIVSSSKTATNITLDAIALNQLGNRVGLLGEKVSSWKLTKSIDGVSINPATGLLTVGAGSSGQIEVEATLIPSYTGAVQKEVKSRISIDIQKEGFDIVKEGSNAKVTALYENKSGSTQTLDLYYVIYGVDSNGIESMENIVYKKNFDLKKGEIFNEEKVITLPSQGEHVLRCFLWQNNLVPAIKSGFLEN